MSGRRLALVVLAGLLASSHAMAQAPEGEGEVDMAPEESPPPDDGEPAPVEKDPKLAKKLAAAAQQLVQKGDYTNRQKKPDEAKGFYIDAINAYNKAIEHGDDVNLYFELAAVEEKLGKLDAAVRHLRIVINATTGVRPDVLKKATAKHDDLSMQVGIVTLQIDPDGTTVSVGDKEIGKSPLAEPVVLMPGSYTVSFTSDGYQPKDIELKVEAGSEAERKIELEPIKIVVKPLDDTPEVPVIEVPAKPPSKLPLYIGAGVAGGAFTIGVITGIVAVSKHGTFTAADSTRSEREDARASGQNLALVSDIFLGTAVVAGGFTAYWYFVKYKKGQAKYAAESANKTSKVDLVPWVQPEAGGLTVLGSF